MSNLYLGAKLVKIIAQLFPAFDEAGSEGTDWRTLEAAARSAADRLPTALEDGCAQAAQEAGTARAV